MLGGCIGSQAQRNKQRSSQETKKSRKKKASDGSDQETINLMDLASSEGVEEEKNTLKSKKPEPPAVETGGENNSQNGCQSSTVSISSNQYHTNFVFSHNHIVLLNNLENC